jgi:pimeloyl-ACP methyl ester carboxylesterase
MDNDSLSDARGGRSNVPLDGGATALPGEHGGNDTMGPAVEFETCGHGPTLVLVPGSCSTGAAWRPVTSQLSQSHRCVTTSLPGYGRTAERRSAGDVSIVHQCEAVEQAIGMAGGPVHLVGHSLGGLVALAVALRGRVALDSLTIFEAPAVGLLGAGEQRHFDAFRALTDGYLAAYRNGKKEAIGAMIDFYGGAGTFASWPQRVRDHAVESTPVNLLDWAGAYAFRPSLQSLSAIRTPTLVCVGALSHASVQRANEVIDEHVPGSALLRIDGASHFMIATHASEVARIIAAHTRSAELAR